MNKELIGIAIIAMIFFGTCAVAAESGLYTFTLRADRVLTDYIGGNATSDKVNITGLVIQAGQVLGYYNETEVDAQINMCFVNDTALLTALNTETSQREGNDTALQSDIDSVNSTLDTHTADTGNPHTVVAEDLTITDSDVPNTITINQAANAHTVDTYHATTSAGASTGVPVISSTTTYTNLKAGYASSSGNSDTVDNYHAGNAANQVPVLDASGKYVGIPKRDINGAPLYQTAELGSSNAVVTTTNPSYECTHKTITVDLTGIDFIEVDYEIKVASGSDTVYVKLQYNTVDYAPWSGAIGTSYTWQSGTADVRSLSGNTQFDFCYHTAGGTPATTNQGLNIHANDWEDA